MDKACTSDGTYHVITNNLSYRLAHYKHALLVHSLVAGYFRIAGKTQLRPCKSPHASI